MCLICSFSSAVFFTFALFNLLKSINAAAAPIVTGEYANMATCANTGMIVGMTGGAAGGTTCIT
jgi:hypothetical protein